MDFKKDVNTTLLLQQIHDNEDDAKSPKIVFFKAGGDCIGTTAGYATVEMNLLIARLSLFTKT